MRLRDIAGAEDYARDAALGQHRGIAEIMDTHWLALARAAQELLDEWQLRRGFHRHTRLRARHAEGGPKFFPRQERFNFLLHARLGFARQRATIHRDDARVGNNIRLGAAANGADVYRG